MVMKDDMNHHRIRRMCRIMPKSVIPFEVECAEKPPKQIHENRQRISRSQNAKWGIVEFRIQTKET